jgi:hypothetical protein
MDGVQPATQLAMEFAGPNQSSFGGRAEVERHQDVGLHARLRVRDGIDSIVTGQRGAGQRRWSPFHSSI